MSRSHTLSPRAAGRRQRGTAFILVLLALVVLTIFGVALTFVTQSELQVGANERLANRAFYTADSGVGIMTARVLVKNDRAPLTMAIDTTAVGSSTVIDEVDASAFMPILDAPCNLCQINNATSYNSNYKRVNNLVTATGARVGIDPTGTRSTLAQQILSAMVDIQPTQIDANSINILDQRQQVQAIGKRQ